MAARIKSVGSGFDEFLQADGLLEEASAIAMKRVIAIKRVIAWQLAQAMNAKGLSKFSMAKRMGSSRAHLDRILDASDPGLTLATLSKAARAVGCRVKVEFDAA